MPVLDGIKATEIILESWKEANALPADRQKCIDAGMADFIGKPLNQAELNNVLAKFSELAPL